MITQRIREHPYVFHWLSIAFGVFAVIFTADGLLHPASRTDMLMAVGLDAISVLCAAFALGVEHTPKIMGGEKSKMGNYFKVILMLILATCIGMATGVILNSYIFPTQYTVQSTSLEFYLDGYPWTNNTLLDWGMIVPDATYIYTNLTIVNTGTTTVNVTHHVMGLPEDWTQTYTANGTILEPTNSTEGQLILTVPPTAQPGEGSYTTYIYANQPE